MSPVAAYRANLAENARDCAELEPLNLGPGGSSLEPEMTTLFASDNARYFVSNCGRKVSAFMPVVEQRRCYGTGEKAYRYYKYYVPQADPEWVNGTAERKDRLKRAAETNLRNVTETLETLGWLPSREGLPIFTPHTVN